MDYSMMSDANKENVDGGKEGGIGGGFKPENGVLVMAWFTAICTLSADIVRSQVLPTPTNSMVWLQSFHLQRESSSLPGRRSQTFSRIKLVSRWWPLYIETWLMSCASLQSVPNSTESVLSRSWQYLSGMSQSWDNLRVRHIIDQVEEKVWRHDDWIRGKTLDWLSM
jgi:hypothetical protein